MVSTGLEDTLQRRQGLVPVPLLFGLMSCGQQQGGATSTFHHRFYQHQVHRNVRFCFMEWMMRRSARNAKQQLFRIVRENTSSLSVLEPQETLDNVTVRRNVTEAPLNAI